MLRNKFLRSCFALALVLSMILPSFAVHADGGITRIHLKKSNVTRKNISRFELNSFEELNLVTGVKVNAKDYTRVNHASKLVEGTYYLEDNTGSVQDRPQVHLYKLSLNNKIEFITAKGKLEFKVINITDRTRNVHDRNSVNFISNDSNQSPNPNEGSNNGEGTGNQNEGTPGNDNHQQPEQGGEGQANEEPKYPFEIASIKRNDREGFHTIRFDPLDTVKTIEKVLVNDKEYKNDNPNYKPREGNNKYTVHINKDYENYNYIRISKLKANDILTLIDKENKAYKFKVTEEKQLQDKSFVLVTEIYMEPKPDTGEGGSQGGEQGQEGGGQNQGEDQGQTTPDKPQSDLVIKLIEKARMGSYHVIEFEKADMVTAVTNVKVREQEYTKIDKYIGNSLNSYYKPPGSEKEIHISQLKDGDVLTLITDKGTSVIKIDKAPSYHPGPIYNPEIVFTPKEANNEEPGTQEPGTQEPGTQEPGTQEPGTQEPGTQEPGTQEPGTQEPGTQEPGTQEPGTQEPGTQEPGTQEPGTQEPGTQEPGTQEPGTQEPGTQEPGTQEPGTQEPGTQEHGTQEPGTQEPGTQEPGNQGNENNNNPGSNNAGNNEAGNADNNPNNNTNTDNSSSSSSVVEPSNDSYSSYDPVEKADATVIEEEKAPLSKLDKKSEEKQPTAEDLKKKLENKEISNANFVKQLPESTLLEEMKNIHNIFKDVKEEDWYAKELTVLNMANLFKGYEDGTFRPENYVTGKEFVTLLVRAAGLELVEAEGDWFAPYHKAAESKGLLKDINFDLSKKITREEIAALAYNFAKMFSIKEAENPKALSFTDEKMINKNYLDAITFLTNKEVLKGRTDASFSPQDMTKRSEISAVIYRLLSIIED